DAGRADAAGGHAAMAGLDHDGDALRMEVFPDAVGDFGSETFLHLQAAGETVEHAGELGNADHAVGRQIGDRSLADDRRHMMFAVALKRDIPEQDDLVVAADFLEHAAEMDRGILPVAETVFLPRPRHALGRIEQALARRIIASPTDQSADRLLHLFGHRRLSIRYVFVGSDQAAHFPILFFAPRKARPRGLPLRKSPPLANGSNISSGRSGSSRLDPARVSSMLPISGGS